MIHTIYERATGRIEKTVNIPDFVEGPTNFLALQFDPATHDTIEGDHSAADFYIERGAPQPIPPRPSAGHVFDFASKAWVDARTVNDLKAAKRIAIEAERRRRTVSPIAYDGALLDADKTAQENIANKLLEIGQRMELGQPMPQELLFWRDHDNIDHTFDTVEEYRAWLGGLAVAITERGTQAYAWSWQAKAALAAADSIQAVEAITW